MDQEGDEAYLSYRGSMAVDTEDGYAKAVRMTSANAAEVSNLKPLLARIPEPALDGVFADKGWLAPTGSITILIANPLKE